MTRIFLGLTEVSGFFHRLKLGFDELGINAVHVTLQPHKFLYSNDTNEPYIVRIAQISVKKRVKAIENGFILWILLWSVIAFFTRICLFIWALIKFDCFILGADSSFFSFIDLPILKFFRKKIIYTLHGTDARPPYIDGFYFPKKFQTILGMENPNIAESVDVIAKALAKSHARESRVRANKIRFIEKYVDIIVCGPSYCHFLSRPFVSLYKVGLPTKLINLELIDHTSVNEKIKILHAPSQLKAKGTSEIRNIIASIKRKKINIEYHEIIGASHYEVLDAISKCDIVIDQFYSDTPMAAFAAEASMFGKPAVVGGYYAGICHKDIVSDDMPRTIFCLPNKLEEKIEQLALNKKLRNKIGKQARKFIESKWNTKIVAEKFFQLFESPPNEWFLNPIDCQHIHGIGLSETQVKANILAMIELYGIDSLQLKHNPILEQKFVDFAGFKQK